MRRIALFLISEATYGSWAKRAVNGRYSSIQHEKACDVADEWNFYNDVIVMLGGENGEPDDEKEL